jgi:hypothetical protein
MRTSRTRHLPWITVVAVAVAGAGLSLAFGREDATTEPAAPTPAMGVPVTREGIFEYTVNSLDCTSEACTVGVTVRNMSDVVRTPGIAFARAYDSSGAEHLPDAVAEIRHHTALLDELAPGARITDRLFYDASGLTRIVLRESAGSSGVEVPLSPAGR